MRVEDSFINITYSSALEIYERLCTEMSFNKMIELYKLIQHKMTYLDDKVVDKCEVMRNEKNTK